MKEYKEKSFFLGDFEKEIKKEIKDGWKVVSHSTYMGSPPYQGQKYISVVLEK